MVAERGTRQTKLPPIERSHSSVDELLRRKNLTARLTSQLSAGSWYESARTAPRSEWPTHEAERTSPEVVRDASDDQDVGETRAAPPAGQGHDRTIVRLRRAVNQRRRSELDESQSPASVTRRNASQSAASMTRRNAPTRPPRANLEWFVEAHEEDEISERSSKSAGLRCETSLTRNRTREPRTVAR